MPGERRRRRSARSIPGQRDQPERQRDHRPGGAAEEEGPEAAAQEGRRRRHPRPAQREHLLASCDHAGLRNRLGCARFARVKTSRAALRLRRPSLAIPDIYLGGIPNFGARESSLRCRRRRRMKKAVDRAVTGERAISAEVAAVWPTGARIPWLPVIETGEAASEAVKKTATAEPVTHRRAPVPSSPINWRSRADRDTRPHRRGREMRRPARQAPVDLGTRLIEARRFGRRTGGTCRDLARSSA